MVSNRYQNFFRYLLWTLAQPQLVITVPGWNDQHLADYCTFWRQNLHMNVRGYTQGWSSKIENPWYSETQCLWAIFWNYKLTGPWFTFHNWVTNYIYHYHTKSFHNTTSFYNILTYTVDHNKYKGNDLTFLLFQIILAWDLSPEYICTTFVQITISISIKINLSVIKV
jgi:hypothetical protein